MAFIVIEVDTTSLEAVTQANQQLVNDSSNPHDGVIALRNLLDAILAGAKDASVQVVVRSTTSTPTASGGGIDATYNLK